MKKFYHNLNTTLSVIILFGLLYFGVKLVFSGHILQSILALTIGATLGMIVMALIAGAHNTDDNMYEVAIVNLQNQIKESENNYDLMRSANSQLQQEKNILELDIQRQAQIIADLAGKNSALKIDLDAVKARLVRCSGISSTKIDSRGNLI